MMTSTKQPKEAGYTLFELVAIMVIISVTAALMLPGDASTQHYRLRLAAEQTASAVRFAHSEALRTNSSFGVSFDAATPTVRVFRVDEATAPPSAIYDVRHPRTRNLYDLTFGEAGLVPGVTVNAAATWSGACTQSAAIAFDGAGVPRCLEPYATLMNSFNVALGLNGDTVTVSIADHTGRVVGP